jgi:hypothetical protein
VTRTTTPRLVDTAARCRDGAARCHADVDWYLRDVPERLLNVYVGMSVRIHGKDELPTGADRYPVLR